MSRQSPHTVKYADLLSLAEELMKDSRARYEGAKGRGTTNLNALQHRVVTSETLVRMLRKGLPGKQTDLFALYQQVAK